VIWAMMVNADVSIRTIKNKIFFLIELIIRLFYILFGCKFN